MESITCIIGGGQILLPIEYDIQPCFEEYLDNEHKLFLADLRTIESANPLIEKEQRMGRPSYPLTAFRRSFYAQYKFRLNTIEELRDRLNSDANLRQICGFHKVPSLPTFCRRLKELAEQHDADVTQRKMITKYMKNRIILNVNRDSTAIEARQRPVNLKRNAISSDTKKYKRGRPRKNEKREVKSSVLLQQTSDTPEQSIAKLANRCQWGVKINSQGNRYFWKGYKLHLDVSDTGIPLTAVVTGANVHDSQLAIPMEQMTEHRCIFLYSLMDSAYDAKIIHEFIRSRGRVPVIDPHKRRNGECRELDPAKKCRFKIRSTVERSNALLKDWFIPHRICVRSALATTFILLNAVVLMTAERLLLNGFVPD